MAIQQSTKVTIIKQILLKRFWLFEGVAEPEGALNTPDIRLDTLGATPKCLLTSDFTSRWTKSAFIAIFTLFTMEKSCAMDCTARNQRFLLKDWRMIEKKQMDRHNFLKQ